MTPADAPVPAGADSPTASSSSRLRTAVTTTVTSARGALTGPSGPALWRGVVGSILLTIGGFGTGSLPVDGGPAAALGFPGFTFGHGSTLALILVWIGVTLMVTSWLSMGPRAISGRLPVRDAAWATALWSLPMLPSIPLFSRDAWSYLAQGAMTSAGVDPYQYGPQANPGVFTTEVSPDWQSTATPYGPLHLLSMRIIAGLSGGPDAGIILLRLAVLAALAAMVPLLVIAARRAGIDAGATIWIACASPLTVIHVAGGLHNEIFPLIACLGAVILTLDRRYAWAGAAVGIAVAFKATAVLVAPFLVWIALDRRRSSPDGGGRPVAGATLDTTLAAVVAAVTFALATVASGVGIGWIHALSVSDRVINYLSAPTAVAHLVHAVWDAHGLEDVLAVARTVGRVLLIVTLVLVWWAARRTAHSALRGIMLAMLAFVVLNTLSWPWYHVWVFAFWFLARPGRRATTAAVCVTVFLVMAIGPNGSTSLYSPPLVGIALAATLLTGVWWTRTTAEVPYSPARSDQVRRPWPGPAA